MKLQGKVTFLEEGDWKSDEYFDDKCNLIKTFFSKNVIRPENKFSMKRCESAGTCTIMFEVSFDEYPSEEFIDLISEMELDYLIFNSDMDDEADGKEQPTEPEAEDEPNEPTKWEKEVCLACCGNVEDEQSKPSEPEEEDDQSEPSEPKEEDEQSEPSEPEEEEQSEPSEPEDEDEQSEPSEPEEEEEQSEPSEPKEEDGQSEPSEPKEEDEQSWPSYSKEETEQNESDEFEAQIEPIESEGKEIVTFYELTPEECTSINDELAKKSDELKEEKKAESKRGRRKDVKAFTPSWFSPIAESAGSFDEFVKGVADKLLLKGDTKEYFITLIKEIKDSDLPNSELYNLKWINMTTLKYNYSKSKVSYLSTQISKRLIHLKTESTMLPFLMGVVQYKNSFSISDAVVDVQDEVESENIQVQEEVKSDEKISEDTYSEEQQSQFAEAQEESDDENAIEFEAFPPIPKFEKWLGTLDYSKSNFLLVKEIMAEIGIEEKKSNPINKKIIDLAIYAVNMVTPAKSIEDYLVNAGIPERSKESIDVRLTFTAYLNDFVSDNYDGKFSDVTTFNFLKGLTNLIKSQK